MNSYTWNATDYAKHSQTQQRWAQELIAKLDLTGTEAVLDVGCGDGKVSVEIASTLSSGTVFGVDSSSAMIELASERYPKQTHPNLSFALIDARQLTFDACFDVVFSNAALHWVKDHRPVIAGMYRSLKPGGKLLLQMGGKGNAGDILSVLEELQATPRWQAYFADFAFPYGFYDSDEYAGLLQDAGFTIKRVALFPKDMVQAGKSGLAGWIRTTWLPYTERVPAAHRDEFIEAITTRYLERVPLDANGDAHVAMVRLEVEAQKPG